LRVEALCRINPTRAGIDLIHGPTLTLIASSRRHALKITDVKATLHRVPIAVPLLKETITSSIVFTTVETDRSVTGYALTRDSQRFGIKEFINREGVRRN
jgi:hypothetical protein